MRKVMVSENKNVNGRIELVERGVADFHQFGLDVDEQGNSYSAAIIEWPNGKVDMVYPYHIRFIKTRAYQLMTGTAPDCTGESSTIKLLLAEDPGLEDK